MTARTAVPTRTRLGAAVAASVAVAVLVLLIGPAAWAHGADGKMTITAAEQSGPLTVRLEVGITYVNDADLAEEAKVEATLTGADGTVVGPVALPQIRNALYGSQVQVPKAGTYAVAVTSTSPAATASGSVNVTGDPTNGSAPSTTAASSSSSAPSTAAPATTTTAAPATTTTSSSSTPLIVVVVVVLVLVGAVGGFLAVRRKGA